MLVKRLDQPALVRILGQLSSGGHTDNESEALLLTFCLNCPDPHGAMVAALDAPRGTTDAQIVDQALAMPARSVTSVPESELPAKHPLRTWGVEE